MAFTRDLFSTEPEHLFIIVCISYQVNQPNYPIKERSEVDIFRCVNARCGYFRD
jgi:hypothetical protein